MTEPAETDGAGKSTPTNTDGVSPETLDAHDWMLQQQEQPAESQQRRQQLQEATQQQQPHSEPQQPRRRKWPLVVLILIVLSPAEYWIVLSLMPGAVNPFAIKPGTKYQDVIKRHGEPIEKQVDSTTRTQRGHYVSVNPVSPGNRVRWNPGGTYTNVKGATLRYRNAILHFGKGGEFTHWTFVWKF